MDIISAILKGNLSDVKRCISSGSDVNFSDTKNKNSTPLAYAINRLEVDIVDHLLSEGANVNAQLTNGNTPLHLAVKKCAKDEKTAVQIVRLLLEKSPKIDVLNQNSETALSLAETLELVEIERVFDDHNQKRALKAEKSEAKCCKRQLRLANEDHKIRKKFAKVLNLTESELNDDLSDVKAADLILDQGVPSEGLKLAMHGNMFQLFLLMLTLWRAKEQKYRAFGLTTEFPEAEKFDDVVLQYREQIGGAWKFRLLQAKHKETICGSEVTKIKSADLLSVDDGKDFMLQKYFRSFTRIKQRSEEKSAYSVFSENEIEDVIVITNTDFESEKVRSYFKAEDESVLENDPILKVNKDANVGAVIYKLSDQDCKFNKQLNYTFKDSSDFNKLIEKIANHVSSKKSIDKKNLFKDYYYALIREVFDITKNTSECFLSFKMKFLDDENLSPKTQKFRSSLLKEIIFREKFPKELNVTDAFGKVDLPSSEKDLKKLANQLVDLYANGNELIVSDFKAHHVALAQLVINVSNRKFRNAFLNSKKNNLICKLKSYFIKQLESVKQFKRATNVTLKKIEFKISNDFGKNEFVDVDGFDLKDLAKKIKNGESLDQLPFEIQVLMKNEVVDVVGQRFKESFIFGKSKIVCNNTCEKLSISVKQLRKILINELIDENAISDSLEWLKNVKLKVSEGFFTAFKPDDNPVITNVNVFAQQLLSLICNGKDEKLIKITDENSDEDFKTNIKRLSGYVIIKRYNKLRFSSMFLYSEDLPGNLVDLKKELKSSKQIEFETLSQYEIEFSCAKPFNFQTCDDGILNRNLPSLHSDDDVREFFRKFKLIVNYPNREQLFELIKKEIAFNFQEVDCRDLTALYESSMNNWMADRMAIRYTSTSANQLFRDLRKDLLFREMEGINSIFLASKHLNLKFIEDYFEVVNFLKNPLAQVLLVSTLCVSLTSMRIVQTVQNLKADANKDIRQYTWRLGRVFITSDQLLDESIRKNILECFRDELRTNLLVIECDVLSPKHLPLIYQFFKAVNHKNKKIIIVVSENDVTSFVFDKPMLNFKFENVFDVEYSLKNFDQKSQDEILKKKVAFQRREMLWNEIITNEQTKAIFNSKNITDLLKDRLMMIGKSVKDLGEISNYYLKRRFRFPEIRKFDDTFSDQLAIDCSETDFNNLRRNFPNKNIHMLKSFEDEYTCTRYVWIKTSGSVEQLIKRKKEMSSKNYNHFDQRFDAKIGVYKIKEKDFISLNNLSKVNIISDIAGMGKSTLLTSLAIKLKLSNPKLWVIRVDLNEHYEVLKEEHGEVLEEICEQLKDECELNSSVFESVMLLSKKLFNLESDLEVRFFECCLKHKSGLVLLFDGFDEICPTCADAVINFIKCVRVTKVDKIWISTRPHARDILEEAFDTLAYSLDAIDEAHQIKFLSKFWEFKNPNLSNGERIRAFATKLVAKMAASISDRERSFTGVPLQLKMLAEVFEKKAPNSLKKLKKRDTEFVNEGVVEFHDSNESEPTFPSGLNLHSLYALFVKNKFFQVHVNEKVKPSTASAQLIVEQQYENYLQNHRKLSLRALFTKRECDVLLKINIDELANLVQLSEREGLIDRFVNNTPIFIHRTFAEYFASEFFIDKLCSNYFQENTAACEFFLKKILFRRNNRVIRAFLNNQWPTLKLSESTIASIGGVMESLVSSGSLFGGLGVSILHTNVDEGNHHVAEFVLSYAQVIPTLLAYELEKGFSSLLVALTKGDFDLARMLINSGCDVNEAKSPDFTLLFQLVTQCCHFDAIEFAVQHGADLGLKYHDGVTIVMKAAEKGNLQVLDLILGKVVDIAIADDNGITVLHYAVNSKNVQIVRRVVSAGCDVEARDENGNTALHYAAYNGQLEMCKWLGLSKDENGGGANLKVKSNDESTLMHEAAISGNLDLCKWLAEQGLSILDKDENGRAPLNEAAKYGNLEVVRWLIEQGADRNAIDEVGNSILLDIAKYGTSELCEWFTSNLLEDEKNAMLHVAVRYGNLDVVKWLVKCGADVNDVGVNGRPPLFEIANTNFGEERKCYLNKYSIGNYEVGMDGVRRYVIFESCLDDETVMDVLVKHGADVSAVDHQGNTILHLLAADETLNLVEYLVANGVDTLIRNVEGKTALNIAEKNNQTEVIKFLV